MDKLNRLLKAIDSIVKEEADELEEKIAEFPAVDATLTAIEAYEKTVANLLRRQKKHFVNGINEFIAKENTLGEILIYVIQNLFASDEFAEEMAAETATFLELTTSELTSAIMESIDEEVSFSTLSMRTLEWIASWSKDLGKLMQLNTHREVEAALVAAIENGEGIPDAIKRLKDLPGFNRNRARATAITEILTANSHSQHEAYRQSPAVAGKKWKHTGSKKNKPRPDHVELNGTVVGVNETFNVGGEKAQYPRDTSLSAKQRVFCHCTMGPEIDSKILKLSKEEKEKLRDEAIKDDDDAWLKELDDMAKKKSDDWHQNNK